MRIGILGGSFDPIHNGHLHMAVCAKEQFSLDQVWLIPAGHSPNKDEDTMTEAVHRLRMCEIAAKPYDWLSVNPIEIDAAETSYTYRTMEKLHEAYPSEEFFFIMGGDSFEYFDKWVRPAIIASLCTILVIPRDCFSVAFLLQKKKEIAELFPCEAKILSCEMYPVSSTQIRKQLCEGRIDAGMIPDDVLDFIQKNQLYGVCKHGFH